MQAALKSLPQRCGPRLGVVAMAAAVHSAAEPSHAAGSATLETLNFDNRTLRELPVDGSRDRTPRPVRGACFSLVRCSQEQML